MQQETPQRILIRGQDIKVVLPIFGALPGAGFQRTMPWAEIEGALFFMADPLW
jgi:hypothetical protein